MSEVVVSALSVVSVVSVVGVGMVGMVGVVGVCGGERGWGPVLVSRGVGEGVGCGWEAARLWTSVSDSAQRGEMQICDLHIPKHAYPPFTHTT